MGNLTKLIADHEKCTYNIISNEILLNTKTNNGQEERLSCGARGLFWTILNLPNDWTVTESGLATITGESEYTIKKLLKELKYWGYLDYIMLKNDKGIFTQRAFIIKEVLNSDIDMDKCIFSSSSDTKSSRVDSHSVENQSDGIQSGGFLRQYNNIINNNIENNNLSLNKDIKTYTNSEEFESEFSQDKINNKHVSHVSQDPQTSSFSKDLKITKQNWAACHDENQEIKNIFNVTDPINEPKLTNKQKRQQEKLQKVKNQVQQMEMEKGDSVVGVNTLINRTMGDMTAEENELSRAVHAANELLELNQAVNKSNMQKLSNIKMMKREADKIISNKEVAKWFKDYLEVKIQKTGHMAKPAVNLLYEELDRISCNNPQTMIIVLKEAIKRGWNSFYINPEIERQVEGLKQIQQNTVTNNNEEEYVELLDENGNPITF